MSDPDRGVKEFKLRLRAYKRATALFLAGHAAFLVLAAIKPDAMLVFGVSGGCYIVAGVYTIVRRRYVQPTAADEGLTFGPAVDDEDARQGERAGTITGLGLIAYGLVWVSVAFGVK